MKRKLLFILTIGITCLFTACANKNTPNNNGEEETNYVDLGLPSGTLWKNANEINAQKEYNLFTFDEAVNAFGYDLPTKEQWQELIDECTWSWTFGGYKIIGPNHNYIILPGDGRYDCDGGYKNKTGDGDYWSAASDEGNGAYGCSFDSGTTGDISWYFVCDGLSVRLVR